MIATAMALSVTRSAIKANECTPGNWSIGAKPIALSVVVDVVAWSSIAVAVSGWP